MIAPTKKGWCPGALRPMPTGDGLLVRLKPSGGSMSLAAALDVAHIGQTFGNGVLEISARANLQLRGLAERDLPEVWRRLAAFGLIDEDAQVEAVRNIMVSPLSDCDPAARCDLRPYVAALEARFAADARLWTLPAKFGVALDAGGRFALDEGAHVIARASEGGWDVFTAASPAPLSVAREALADAIARVALETAERGFPAMRDRGDETALVVGALTLGSSHVVILAPPLGRMRAGALTALLRDAADQGALDLRLMPRRRIALTGFTSSGAAAMCGKAEALGYIVAGDDRRLGATACAGAPACASAARDVQGDALALSPSLPTAGGIVLHVSGCEKGCARAAPTRVTLIARVDGYDAVRNGRADGVPAFQHMTLDAARALVAQECGAT